MNRDNYRLYAVILAALILRLYTALTSSAVPDYSDMALYNGLALAGGFPTSLPPAYPLFLRLVYAVFGPGNYTAVFVIQALLSTATVYLIFFVTSRIADRRAGLIAAAVSAIYPNFIAYNLTTMTETTALLFVMLLLASLVAEIGEPRRSVLSAAVLCLGFYVRPIFLFFVPGVLPFVRKRLWFIGAAVVLLAPWFIAGAVSEGGAGRGARMFYKSYNPRSDGITNYDLSETELGSEDLPGSVYLREALDFVRGNGWQTVNIIYNKSALLLCRGYDQYVLKDIAGGNKYIMYMFYYLHIPIFLLGAVMMIRFYDGRLAVLVWPAVSYLVLTILYAFFKFRYRLPIEPMFIMASAVLVSRLVGERAARLRRSTRTKGDAGKKGEKGRGKKGRAEKYSPAGKGGARASEKTAAPHSAAAGATFRGLASEAWAGIRLHWKALVSLLAVSIVLRIIFALKLGIVPAREEALRIVGLATAGGFGPGDPPLYPILVKAVFALAGGPKLAALYVLQGLIGAAAVALIFYSALRIFDSAAALIAGAIAAVYVNFLIYGVSVDTALPAVFLFALLSAAAVSGLEAMRKAAACGLITGVGAMVQPQLLFLAPGLLFVLDRRKVFLAALAGALLPLTIINSVMSGSFVPLYPASMFGLGAGNFIGLADGLAVIDKLYNNLAVLLSRGWDKQQRVDLAGIIYMARYGYVLVALMGLAGVIRRWERGQGALLLPVSGYVLVLVLFSRFLFQQRPVIEPVLIVYAGALLAGGFGLAVSLIRRPSRESKGAGEVEGAGEG